MFWALWNYFNGYVIIRVSGFSVERFINLAANKGIYIWDLCPDKAAMLMKVSVKDFKTLRECGKKSRCRFKIVGKKGFPFKAHKMKKRKVLAAGFVLFVASLYILSSFLWIVEIKGNQRIPTEEILNYCEKINFKAGELKKNLNTKVVADSLLADFDDISWVAVNIKGTKAEIKIVETIPKPEIVDRTTPVNIIAAKAGIITSVAASAGTPIVKENDVVEIGDLLVSSEIVIKDGDMEMGKEYVHAAAEITAKVWYNMEFTEDLVYTEKQYTGNTKTDKNLDFFDSNINFIKPKIPFEYYDEKPIYSKTLGIGDYKFPVTLNSVEYNEYIVEEKTRTVDEAKILIENQIENNLTELLMNESQIIDKKVEYTQTENKLSAKCTIVLNERIDKEDNASSEEGEIDNGGETNTPEN